jgi:formylglycine-generating enzyme
MKRGALCFVTACVVPIAISCADDEASIDCPDGLVGFSGPGDDLCIDAFEVSNAQYAAFLTENGNTCGGNQECMHIDEPGSHVSQQGNDFVAAAGYEELPVVQVTYNGADAYCAAAAGFLCPDAMWVAACEPAAAAYPYGSSYDPTACNGADFAADAPVAVGSLAGCEGGSDDLFDMSGNVYEWTDACGGGSCLIRGGAFGSPSADLACEASHEMDGPSGHREDLGLRCCASAL